MMQVYATATARCDYEIGRILDVLAESGQLDNMLVIYIEGDNGASAEGTLQVTTNEVSAQFRVAGVSGVDDRSTGQRSDLQPLPRRLGPRDEHAVPMDQASRVALRRNAAGMMAGWRIPPRRGCPGRPWAWSSTLTTSSGIQCRRGLQPVQELGEGGPQKAPVF
jgi:arylsulfatase A-like enzyme